MFCTDFMMCFWDTIKSEVEKQFCRATWMWPRVLIMYRSNFCLGNVYCGISRVGTESPITGKVDSNGEGPVKNK